MVRRHDVPQRQFRAAVTSGELVRVLPSYFTAVTPTFEALCRAIRLWDPRAVITGDATVRLHLDPHRPVSVIEVADRDDGAAARIAIVTKKGRAQVTAAVLDDESARPGNKQRRRVLVGLRNNP